MSMENVLQTLVKEQAKAALNLFIEGSVNDVQLHQIVHQGIELRLGDWEFEIG